MGIMGFLTLFLVLIFFVFPMITKEDRTTEGNVVEARGTDGSILVFSEDGISVFKNGEFKLLRKEELTELSVRREGNTYKLIVKTKKETLEVPVIPEEIWKLFKRNNGSVELAVPWLSFLLSTAVSALLLEDYLRTIEQNNFDDGEFFNDDVEV